MRIETYLQFNGQCAEAFDFYAKCLNGKIVFKQTHGDSPMKDQVPANWQDKVMHATLEAAGSSIMGSDAPPDRYQQPQGFSVSIQLKDVAEGERIFNALSAQGSVMLPFQKTFWSPGFGMAVDRFGIPWMVNCDPA